MMKSIRVVLADDHRLLREGIRSLVERVDDIEVVAEAGDGREALAMVKAHQPDVLVIDIGMKGMNGLEAAARVSKDFPRVGLLMLTVHADEEYVLQALQAGAAGYLLKDSSATELELAIRSVARDEMYLAPAVSRHVLDDYVRRVGGENRLFDALTPRHREVLQLIAEGNTTKGIAGMLHLGVKTVETHRTQLMDRLDIHDVAGLVRYAIRHRVIDAQQ